MYPQVFLDYAEHRRTYTDVHKVPTRAFFYGMEVGDEIAIELETGRTLIVRFLVLGDVDEHGMRTVFFELNGQPRSVRIKDDASGVAKPANRIAETANPQHVGAPMPGIVSRISAKKGQSVKKGDTLLSIEAMKMETAVTADRNGMVAEVVVAVGTQVNAKDLLIVFED
jgi:pyruvate carboxylase